MTLHKLVWTDGLGIPWSEIIADVDPDLGMVTVDETNRTAMVDGIRASGIFPQVDEDAFVAVIKAYPLGVDGRIDVTDLMPWSMWVDDILDCGTCKEWSHPGRDCSAAR